MILGTEGEQPFEIKQEAVSRNHARITVNGDVWELEDLESTNGTYIRMEDGELRPLGPHGKCTITPMTYICLGPDSSKGCGFYARQIMSPSNGYVEEYEYLLSREEENKRQLEQLEKTIKKIRIAGCLFMPIMMIAITHIPFINDLLGSFANDIRYIILPASTLFPVLYDGNARKARLKEKRKEWYHCPNPACAHHLRPEEIYNMQCNKCQK